MMYKRLVLFFVLFPVLAALYGQSAANPAPQIDGAVKETAGGINRKIPAGGSPKIAVNVWVYHDSVPALGLYWAAQLTEELTNIPGRSFILVSGGAADWTISGEIIETPGAAIRIYTRLIRSVDHSITASFHSDFDFNEYIAEMLSDGGGGRSPSVIRDAWEPDSWENPLAVETSAGGEQIVSRTLHAESDEDFFLFTPDRDGFLLLETTGNTDTYMELYNADPRDKLADNDDGGSGGNARIRYQVRPGNSYIAKVRGYGGETGSYGFGARFTEAIRSTPDEYEEDDDFTSAKEISPGTPQRHTFTTGNDVDWVKFQISRPGSYTIRARGVNSARLDTYIELYDGNRNSIDDNDDGGEDLDSRLSVRLQAGTYYLKVECLDEDPDEPYTISVAAD
ncbi:MAG: PPC domain-containing protein [Treponema sp.]|jgi:hypothetical protein|nr:PPC domain-containing protein [Treponema sp.]